ncbi:MAG: flagellar biosynthetic protein FliR [Bdellovibrionota bacterium]
MNFLRWNEIQVLTFFFVLVRVSSMLAFLPLLGDRTIPANIKILFGLALSFVVFPLLWSGGVRVDYKVFNSTSQTIWVITSEVSFGILVGFVSRWIFDAVQVAGHVAGTSIGFSMASVLDPHTETQNIALAELQYILVALLFLSMDGHHVFLSAILKSFEVAPLAAINFFANTESVAQYLIQMSAEVLLLGVKLCAPILVVILLLNLAMGIMARAVPHMNVLAVSFSVNILVGLLVVLVSLPGFLSLVGSTFDVYMPELFRFMRLFGG